LVINKTEINGITKRRYEEKWAKRLKMSINNDNISCVAVPLDLPAEDFLFSSYVPPQSSRADTYRLIN